VGDKLLLKTGQIEVNKAHLFSQWATSKVKWHWKIEKEWPNHNNMLTAGSQLTDLWLAPEKRSEAKKQTSNKPTQKKPKSEAGWLLDYRADLQNLRKRHTLLKEQLTKKLPLKDRKKKTGESPQPPGKTKETFCLNTNTRTGCWRSNSRITKTEILFFLNLEFFMCLFDHLFVLFPVCLSTLLLISLVFFFFSFFVLLVLLLWDS
jgi:hypothetical protein